MLARLFVIFGGLLVLALTAALVGPYFINWTSYRADFERQASAILGRKVTVEGEASARFLPFPSVTFADVAVAGGPDGEPAMTIETFSMDAELAPFLTGEFLIFDMRLVRPKGSIDIAADGTIDWAMRPSTPFDAARISLEKLTITEGQITVRHAESGRSHVLSEINTEVSARSLAGPWRFGGTLRLDGMRMAVSVSTGKVDETGSMRLRVVADPAVYPAVIEADGNVRLDKGAPTYVGAFKITGKDEPELAESTAKAEPGYRLNGKFTLDHQHLSVDEFLFETGPLDNPYAAEGNGLVELGKAPRFLLEMDGAQMRFDEAIAADESSGDLTLSERLAALEIALAELPRPAIPGQVDVNLPAVVAGDTTIRDVRLSAEPAEGGWTLKSFTATLPGRTTLEAGGKLKTDGEFGFTGFLLLAIGQPSGFAAWVSKDVDDAIRRLPAAGFQARVDLTAERQIFSDLELALGPATFRGEADSRQPRDAKPSAVLKLTGGALDVDGLAAFASLFVSDQGASRFADRDLDIAVKAGPVSAAGLTADTVDTALRLRDGLLEIDRLSIGGLAGATISATGTVKDFATDPTGDVDASIVAVDLAPLIAAAAERFKDNVFIRGLDARAAAYPGLFEDARIDVVATAAANDDGTTGVAVSAHGAAGATTLSATLSGNGAPEDLMRAQLSLGFEGQNDDATALLALYGLPVLPLGIIGPGETGVSVKGTLADGLETTAKLTGRDFSADFAGTTAIGGDALTAKGKAKIEAADVEPWLMTIGAGMPGMGTGMPVALEMEADYADGLLVLAGLNGTVDEGAVSGDINASLKDGKPHLTGQLTLDELDLDPLVSMVLGEASLESAGQEWPDVPFQPMVLAPFSAELQVAAATLSAGTLATAHEANSSLRLDGEGLRLADFSAKLYGGEIAGLFELKNTGGTGLFSAQAKFSRADLTEALGNVGLSGLGDFSTALTASGKSVGGLVAALSGSGTAALKSLDIAGINPGALAGFIQRADAIGKDIDAAKTAAFAPEIAAAGTFSVKAAETAFTVAGGVLRAPPLKLDNAAATIETDLQADLNAGTIAVDGTISYRPGDEALVGSEPALRFSLDGAAGAPERVFDSEPLTQFLTQRALEIEQARVEAMQAALLEKQRLRREVRYYAALKTERVRAVEEQRQREEEARLRAEEAARIWEEAEAKARIEAEAKRQADEKARLDAADKAKQQADEKAAAEAKRAADEARKRQAQEKRKADEAVRLAAEEEARRAAQRDTGLPGVDLSPLSSGPADDPPAPRPKVIKPFGNFFQSLGQ
jgi:uncharacterized protein involved in outer membrane biogenesis